MQINRFADGEQGQSWIQFDRSRRQAWEKCPRARWWNYEYGGKGIEAVERPAYFEIGTRVHNGIQGLLGFTQPEPAGTCLTEEEKALVRALVECWRLVRLDDVKARYEVLSCEVEERARLDEQVEMLVRPDLLLKRKDDGALFTMNFKTTKKVDRWWIEQWKHDLMTISEVVAVEQRLQVKLSGVIIEGLIKGDTGTADGKYASPLTWAWRNETGKPNPELWSAEWVRGWTKRPIWQHYGGGVEQWCRFLLTNNPEVLYNQIVTLEPILRNDAEIVRWQEQVICEEIDIRDRRELVTNEKMLNGFFPMHTNGGNCIRPVKCSYYPICWEGAEPDDERFRGRVINHVTEGQ